MSKKGAASQSAEQRTNRHPERRSVNQDSRGNHHFSLELCSGDESRYACGGKEECVAKVDNGVACCGQ